eukprot:3917860-Prymnesium_polylepis.1
MGVSGYRRVGRQIELAFAVVDWLRTPESLREAHVAPRVAYRPKMQESPPPPPRGVTARTRTHRAPLGWHAPDNHPLAPAH